MLCNSGETWGAKRSRDSEERNLPDLDGLENEANSGRVNGAKLFGSHCGWGCSAKGGGMPVTVEVRSVWRVGSCWCIMLVEDRWEGGSEDVGDT